MREVLIFYLWMRKLFLRKVVGLEIEFRFASVEIHFSSSVRGVLFWIFEVRDFEADARVPMAERLWQYG